MIIKGRTRINYRLYAFEPKEQEQLVSINYDVTTDGNVSVQLRVGEKAETSNMGSSQFKRKKESPIHYPTIPSNQIEKKDSSIHYPTIPSSQIEKKDSSIHYPTIPSSQLEKKDPSIHYPTIPSSQLEKKDYFILPTKNKTSARISRMYSGCSDSNEPTAPPATRSIIEAMTNEPTAPPATRSIIEGVAPTRRFHGDSAGSVPSSETRLRYSSTANHTQNSEIEPINPQNSEIETIATKNSEFEPLTTVEIPLSLAQFSISKEWQTGNHAPGVSFHLPIARGFGVDTFIGMNSKGYLILNFLPGLTPKSIYMSVTPGYYTKYTPWVHYNVHTIVGAMRHTATHVKSQYVGHPRNTQSSSQLPQNCIVAPSTRRRLSPQLNGISTGEIVAEPVTVGNVASARRGNVALANWSQVARPVSEITPIAPYTPSYILEPQIYQIFGVPVLTQMLIASALSSVGLAAVRAASEVRKVANYGLQKKEPANLKTFIKNLRTGPGGGGVDPTTVISDYLWWRRVRSVRWYILAMFIVVSILLGIELFHNKGKTITSLLDAIRGISFPKQAKISILEESFQDAILKRVNSFIQFLAVLAFCVIFLLSLDPVIRIFGVVLNLAQSKFKKSPFDNGKVINISPTDIR